MMDRLAQDGGDTYEEPSDEHSKAEKCKHGTLHRTTSREE
jgi:hypothetical protein